MRLDVKQLRLAGLLAVTALALAMPVMTWSHGNVQPQAVDTTGLKSLGDTWLTTNPYRGDPVAIKIGAMAYNQQCARCHGIGGVSGGLATDLRTYDLGDEGDKYFIPPVRRGVFRDGRTLMPKYEGILSQEAMWAIRSWLETVHVD